MLMDSRGLETRNAEPELFGGHGAEMAAVAPAADAFPAELLTENDRTGVAVTTPRKASRNVLLPALTLVAADALAFALALPVAGGLGPVVGLPVPSGLGHATAILAALVLCLNATVGLYPGYGIVGEERLRRRVATAAKVAALGSLAAWLMGVAPAAVAALALVLATALILQPLLGQVARVGLRRLGLWGKSVAIVAPASTAEILSAYLCQAWELGFRPAGAEQSRDRRGRSRRVGTVLVASSSAPLVDLPWLRRAYTEVILLADMPSAAITGIRPREIGGEMGIRLAGTRPTAHRLQRAFDLAFAVPMTIAAVPLIALCGLAIRAVDPGSAFYTQEREGLDGRPIRVLKLRTMYRDAEQRLQDLLATDPEMRGEWERHFKLRNDPRILAGVGHFLRATSLDELPQLFNVLAGDMRLIGPRPFPIYHIGALDPEFRVKRASVTPGLTGLWQISGRSDADLELSQRLDDYYIDNSSLWLDLRILFGTIAAVFRRGGAY